MLICRCPRCMCDLSGYERDVPPICGYGMDESWAEYKHGLCPLCGFDIEGTEQPAEALPRNTILHGKYLIGNVLGQGGFGITYIGFDLSLEIKVAIKEYYPAGAASRREGQSSLVWNRSNMSQTFRQSAYDDFLKEARKMAKMDQIPSIVRVRETFLENETAYIVMDFVEGETLKARLKRDGVMKFSDCITLLRPMMEDLEKVHAQGLIHRDISPDNIMIQLDGKVKLLDLGAAKDLTLQKEGVSQLVTKKGFSPFEQYRENGHIGPWTDVYALCATIYYACYGRVVSPALDRMEQDDLTFDLPTKEPLSQSATAALQKGLAIRAQDRTQSVEQLLIELKEASPEDSVGASKDNATAAAVSTEGTCAEDKVQDIAKEGGEQNVNTVSGLGKNDAEEKTDHSREDKLEYPITPAPRRFPKWMIPTVAAVLVCAVAIGIYTLGSESDSGEIPIAQQSTGDTEEWGEPESEDVMAESSAPSDTTEEQDSQSTSSSTASSVASSSTASSVASSSAVTQVQNLRYRDNAEGKEGFYSGQVVNGIPSGKGKIVYDNGSVYDGDWVNGVKSGHGRFILVDGGSYEGELLNDLPNGRGIMEDGLGNRYEGEFANGMKNGQGTSTWADGSRYSGSWVNDSASGYGVLSLPSGDRYEGNFTNDQMNGQGIFYFNDGSKYEGAFVNGVISGYGVFTYTNGDVYEGNWSNNMKNGQGKMYYAKLNEQYEGNWVDDERSGYGVLTSANGDRYEGNWESNFPNGEGTMTYADGKTITKIWSKEQFMN